MTTRYALDGVIETKLIGRATKADVERFQRDFDALRPTRRVVWIFDATACTGYAMDCVAAASSGFLARRDRLAAIVAVTTMSIVRLAAVSISVTTTPIGLRIVVCEDLPEAHRRAEEILRARAAG